ncbi:MAG TPA: VWA domain-containing protein [Candidatus Binatia bacterium]
MEFLNPAALYGLFALPLLLIPYLVRRKPRRVIFSSLLLFIEHGSEATAKPWGRLRLPLVFFLQLLLLVLLILALAQPVFSVRLSNIAIVMDNSASMQAREDGTTRVALARDQARRVLGDLGANGKVDIFTIVPQLEKANKAPLSPSDAIALLAGLEAYDLADAPADYGDLLRQLAEDHKYERVYFVTDRPVRGQSGAVRVLTVGKPRDNLALSAFTVSPSSLANRRLEAVVEVANYSARDQRVRVAVLGDGAETALANRDLRVPAGQTASASFQGLSEKRYYIAEIDGNDALSLDNRQFAIAANARSLKILAISPRPQALNSLRAIPGVTLTIVAPEDYQQTDRSSFGLEIFHYAALASLPLNPSLLILPPDSNPIVKLGNPITGPVASGWRESHPLSRYLNFALFRPTYARPIIPLTAGEAIIETVQGPLAFTVERQGNRHLVLGFDPFPYLGRENLPMSIFTLNLLEWFTSVSGGKGRATGEPVALGAAEQESSILTTPQGQKHVLKPGSSSFANTFHQGIYQLARGAERQILAINYHSASESDLRDSKRIELKPGASGSNSGSTLFSFWPYLLMASLLLLIIEWFFVPPADRRRLPVTAPRPT